MTRAEQITEGLEKSLQCHLVEAQISAQSALNMLQIDDHDTPNFFDVLIEHTTRLHDAALQAQELRRALRKIAKDDE